MKKIITCTLLSLCICSGCKRGDEVKEQKNQETAMHLLLNQKLECLIEEALLSDSIQRLEKTKEDLCIATQKDFDIALETKENTKQSKQIFVRVRNREEKMKKIESMIEKLCIVRQKLRAEIQQKEQEIKNL